MVTTEAYQMQPGIAKIFAETSHVCMFVGVNSL